MTAAMRAAPRPTGSRALRAALVQGGRILDERVIPPGEHLTVGPTERNTFVVAGLAGSTRLLEHGRAGYRLRLGPGMRGRVALAGEVAELCGAADEQPILLDEDARGRVAIGDALVLFHFVEQEVAVAKPQLPLAVKQGFFEGLDWRTTFIAAFSFLAHFGAVGAAYSDFADSVLPDDGARIARAIDIIRELPAPPPVEGPMMVDANAADANPAAPKAGPVQPSKQGGVARPGPTRTGGGGEKKMSDARAETLLRGLAEEGGAMLAVIGAGGEGKGATDNVLRAGGDLPLGDLGGAAADANGVRGGGVPGLSLGGGGGVVHPGQRGNGIADIAERGRIATGGDVGQQGGPRKPIATTVVSPPESSVGEVPDAGRVVGGLRGRLRQCYQRELNVDPGAKGSVRVTATIGPNGDVTGVRASASGLSSNMVECVSGVVRGAVFGAPKSGGRAMVAIPMSFQSQ